VQDFADANLAARGRSVDLIVPAAVYREWIVIGEAPEQLPASVLLTPE
jgi:hypothetical protein